MSASLNGLRARASLLLLSLAMAAGLALVSGCQDEDDGLVLPPPVDPIQQHWPRFRGPGGLGVLASGTAPTTWDESQPAPNGILWQQPIPLRGASSPVVCGDLVFLTGADEATREIYCYDAGDGTLLWTRSVATGGSPTQTQVWEPDGVEVTYAACTAVMDGERVYAIFGNGDIGAFDYEGSRYNVRSLGLPDITDGPASSLDVCGDVLIVQMDQMKKWDNVAEAWVYKSRLLALDKLTLATVWERSGAAREVDRSWASPIVVNAAGCDQVITCAEPLVVSYDPVTGDEIWRADCLGSADLAVSPIYADGLVIAVGGSGAVAIRPDGTGDVTSTHVEWTSFYGSPDGPSPVAVGQRLFLIGGYGAMGCRSTVDGSEIWSDVSSLSGDKFFASPVAVGDSIYAQRNDGVMFIFSATENSYVSAGGGTLTDDFCCASPAFAHGRIYIRGKDTLYCIGN